jgi:hypothetical protein
VPDLYETVLLAWSAPVLIGHTDDMVMARLQRGGASSDDHGQIDKDWRVARSLYSYCSSSVGAFVLRCCCQHSMHEQPGELNHDQVSLEAVVLIFSKSSYQTALCC